MGSPDGAPNLYFMQTLHILLVQGKKCRILLIKQFKEWQINRLNNKTENIKFCNKIIVNLKLRFELPKYCRESYDLDIRII